MVNSIERDNDNIIIILRQVTEHWPEHVRSWQLESTYFHVVLLPTVEHKIQSLVPLFRGVFVLASADLPVISDKEGPLVNGAAHTRRRFPRYENKLFCHESYGTEQNERIITLPSIRQMYNFRFRL